jgi:hypothetical protein
MAASDYFIFADKVLHTGSRVICNPIPLNTDDDYLLLIATGNQETIQQLLTIDGYIKGGSLGAQWRKPLEENPDYSMRRLDGTTFRSWKKGEINIILTCDKNYFENFYCATLIAKRLNLLRKEERVELFEAICFDRWPKYDDLLVKDR